MKYRRTTILAEESQTVNATRTIDINVKDIISSIYLRIRATNASSAITPAGHPAGFASKIQLVDGSDVLFELDGYQCQALNYYDRMVTPDTEITDGGSEDQWASYLLDFGRYLYDPMLALDPSRFRNLQLKVTNDYDLVDTSAAAGYLKVEADVFDEKAVNPVGFLMTKEIEEYTMSGSAAHHYVDLPRDHPYRKLLIRGYITNVAPNGIFDTFKLSEDNDKRIPIDVTVDHYLRAQFGTMPHLMEHFVKRVTSTLSSVYVMPTYWPFVAGMCHSGTTAFQRATYYQAERQGILTDSANSRALNGLCWGYVPHHTICFPFGNQQDLEDWYDVSNIGSLRGDIYSSTAAAVTSMFAQQMRRY